MFFFDRKLGAYTFGTWFAQAELDSQKSGSKGGSHPAPGRAKSGGKDAYDCNDGGKRLDAGT